MGLFGRKNKNGSSSQSATSGSSVKSPVTSSPQNGSSRQSSSINDNIPLPKAPDPTVDPVGYLRSIYAVRERSKLVLEKAKKDQLNHFNVDMDRFSDTAGYVVSIIKVRHSRLLPWASLTILAARFRSRLCIYSSPRPMAAL